MARKQQQQSRQPISLSQARRRRRPGKPSGAFASPSAADQLAERAWLKERMELTGQLDSYHAYRGGYWQGALDALLTLELLVNGDIALEIALDELRAWLMSDDFGQWVNAPDDPQEIAPGPWLARRASSGGGSSDPHPPSA